MNQPAPHTSELQLGCYASVADLPARYDRLFEEAAAREGYYHSRSWYETVTEYGITENGNLEIITADLGQSPLLVLPVLKRKAGYREALSRKLEAFSSFYTCHFTPIVDPDIDAAVFGTIIQRLGADGVDIVRFQKFDPSDPNFNSLRTALEIYGFGVETRFDFGNWRETVRSDSYESYLGRRPSRLRKHIRRYRRNLEDEHGPVVFHLVRDETGLDEALADYWRVYEMSWKGDEARPDFVEAIIRKSAAEGKLRLGVLKAGGVTVAVKLAFLDGGIFSQFKAAYNPEFNTFGPGTLINDLVFEQVLSTEPVREFEFGNGDEVHKTKWAAERRERWTLTGYNMRTLRGRVAYTLLMLARAVRKLRHPARNAGTA